ncbi:hypothetical protein HOA59_02555 [archaeon]|jgi:hypothetical protein|nr:hypothetical protein [archaeon]MBT6824293.1 hypothetical protein [archaeon]MBT7107371.1 hypothetical protein [archaeon]MBT7297337.1 hypothetical protein [archaeon]
MGNNRILNTLDDAKRLSAEYNIPLTDIILIGLNIEGAYDSSIVSDRMRFNMVPDNSGGNEFYFALTNTKDSRWKINGGELSFNGERIGKVGNTEEDTCDNTYWRRFISLGGKNCGTELTINSNSRSFCSGCEFCGTYNLSPEDQDEKDLSNPDKLRRKLDNILLENDIVDLSNLHEIGVVTGCFPNENLTLQHLNMLHDVLRGDYDFSGELKYVGSQIQSREALENLVSHGPTGISQTVECFERRDILLQPKKQLSLDFAREILDNAKDLGINTTLLYIMGLDKLSTFENEMKLFVPYLTKMPVINTLQEYVEGQSDLRVPEARSMEYYLKARKIMEEICEPLGFKPNVWENYRGLWFTEYSKEGLENVIRI